jgi:MFS family permease
VSGAHVTTTHQQAPRILRAVLGATFFVRFGFGLALSVFAAYIIGRSVGIDPAAVGTVGLISALAPIGEFSTVILTGMAADRHGRVKVLTLGLATAAVLMLFVGATRNVWALGLLNLFFGVSSAAILASSLAVVAQESAEDRRGFEMGRFDAVNLLGWIGGFAVGFGLLGRIGNADLGWVFVFGAAVLALGLLLVRRLTRGYQEERGEVRFSFGQIRRAALSRSVILVTFPWLVIYMLIGTVFVFLGTAATGAGIPSWELAALIGGGGLLLLLTQPSFGRMADRFGRIRLMLVGTIGFVGVLIGAGLLASYGPQPAILGFVGVSVLAALAYGPAALASLTDLSESLTRATTMAVYTLVISLGMLLGLLASSGLYSRYGTAGLDVFFASIAVTLVAFTAVRYHDLKLGRSPEPAPVATTPAR